MNRVLWQHIVLYKSMLLRMRLAMARRILNDMVPESILTL